MKTAIVFVFRISASTDKHKTVFEASAGSITLHFYFIESFSISLHHNIVSITIFEHR